MMSSCALLSTVTVSAQLCNFVIKRVFRFSGVSTGHSGKKLLCCSLNLSTGTCSLSLSPLRQAGGVHTIRRTWTADVSLKASSTSTILRRQRPAPGQLMTAAQTKSWQLSCIFCLLVNEPRSYYNRTQVTTCARATRLLLVWHVWRFLVRYNNRRRRRRADQKERSFLSLFFHF